MTTPHPQGPQSRLLSRLGATLRRRLVAGGLLLVPIVVTYLVLRWAFLAADGILQPVVRWLTGELLGEPKAIPGAGLVGMVILVYLLGLLATNVVGRYIIHLIQQTFLRTPLVNTVYRASKQLVDVLTSPPEREFRRVVMVEVPMPGVFALGFHTGTIIDQHNNVLAVVYIPTAPLPNSGWITIVPLDKVHQTDITVGQAMRMVISGGVLTPTRVVRTPFLGSLQTNPTRVPDNQ